MLYYLYNKEITREIYIMITEYQKLFITGLAAIKPITYATEPTENTLRKDCIDYVLSVFPEWNLSQMHYFFELVKSYTLCKIVK